MDELATPKQESQELTPKAVYEAPALVTGFDADHSRWAIARMFPSVSLNQAVFAPQAVTMLFLHRQAGHGVLLELHSSRFQFGHLGFHVLDLPKGLAGLGCASIGSRVHKDFGAPAFVDYATRVFCLGLKANELLVEFPSACDVR